MVGWGGGILEKGGYNPFEDKLSAPVTAHICYTDDVGQLRVDLNAVIERCSLPRGRTVIPGDRRLWPLGRYGLMGGKDAGNCLKLASGVVSLRLSSYSVEETVFLFKIRL